MCHLRPALGLAAACTIFAVGAAFAQDPPTTPAPPAVQAPPAAAATPPPVGSPPPAAPAAPSPIAAPAPAPSAPKVATLPGGVTVSSGKTILENAEAARDLADFTAGVKAADLEATLGGPGPFTAFIPDTGAFDRLPKGELPGWMRPDGKRKLADVLSYHVVKGALSPEALAAQVAAGKGEAAIPTLQGGYLTVKGAGRNLVLTDVNGTRARVRGEAEASNGVIYIIDAVLQP